MFNFINYISAILGLTRIKERNVYEFRLKQWLGKWILIIFLSTIIFINHLFLLLDEVFFFYRLVRIKEPVLISGVPRTGTTFLYRTMAEDKENFTCFTLGEIIFAPSLIQKYLFYFFYKLDQLIGAPLKNFLLFLGSKIMVEYKKIHLFEFFKPEEDELILLNLFSTVVLKYLFPRSRVFDKYIEFDEKLSASEKRNILNFQKRCIKKHLFFWRSIHGKQKIFLSKNPIYSPKINSLFQYYPGLRVVVAIRDLDQVVPSFISMNAAIIKGIHFTEKPFPDAIQAKTVITAWNDQLFTKMEKQDNSRYYCCRYEDFTSDIKKSVKDIYQHFEINQGGYFQEILKKRAFEQKHYKSNHKYDSDELEKAIRGE